ncbi:alpha/beta fold hydrolase [Streptomyces sp. UNOB3_S3]|uniref:alpha/beta fold hydrolase n=1 Tax=Streptomyces sp. UNOB3_S3 TaxID=2871682 RepID=UPI001E30D7B0|nr:alpha/beta fold hydrolase [Streptomyces sp. UNOB3_S3]MCC3777286.1 alpha/beta hydrolase [Streptomyces sp. UNOB3_S3]
MDTLRTGTLGVPGARLYYEVRGAGPPLLLITGGNSDAAVFEDLAAVLAARFRVVGYDLRGNSRSVLSGPPVDQRIEAHADDASRLLAHLFPTGEPVHVFGSCLGALVGLELTSRHPDRVRAVVAHEPPAVALLPDAEEHLALVDDVVRTFHREGVVPALRRLSALFDGRPAPALPEERDNSAFFLAHVLRPSMRFVPDLAALAAVADRVTMAGGHDSRAYVVHRPAVALARRLGHRPVLFPGGHVGYAGAPGAFAERLVEVFATRPAGGADPGGTGGTSGAGGTGGPGARACAS